MAKSQNQTERIAEAARELAKAALASDKAVSTGVNNVEVLEELKKVTAGKSLYPRQILNSL